MTDAKRFYILTDTHYVSKRSFTPGSRSFARREKGDQIALEASVEILRSFFARIIADPDADAVLITGDLVNNGDRVSHEDFIGELKALTDAGKRVFVTTATHDYCGMGDDENFFKPCRYTDDGCEPAEPVRKHELAALYHDFGPAQSSSVDPESGSYSLPLYEGVRLIALNDNGNGRSHCGLFDAGFKWLEEEIDKANAAGECVLLAVHHPVLPPWEVYRTLVDFELFGGYERLKRLMCEKNVRVIFTGHTHVQSIRKYEDGEGRYFYDVATTAAVTSAGCMRQVDISPENRTMEISSVRLDTIEGFDTGGKSFHDYVYSLNFVGAIERALPLARTDWDRFLAEAEGPLPVDKLKKHKFLVKTGLGIAEKLTMKLPGRFGRKYGGVSKAELKELKKEKLLPVLFTIVAHVFAGNAPYSPETAEYKALKGAVLRADKLAKRFKIKGLDKIMAPGETLWDVAEPFVCNNRTGDDDNLRIEL